MSPKVLSASCFGRIAVLSLGIALSAWAIVPPNPQSLLAAKKVLLINGKETSGSHFMARQALATKFAQLKTLVGFQLTTADGANPPTQLDGYDIIIFSYWFDNQLSPPAFQAAFKNWMTAPGKKRGWLGTHTSGANEPGEWDWLRDSVTSMNYFVHTGDAQKGVAKKTTDPEIIDQPILSGLADTFQAVDEWYEFDQGKTWPAAKVMYYLDEKSLAHPLAKPMNPHPMAWYREDSLTGARFFFTPMVHDESGVNSTAGNDFFASLMLRGLEYIAGYETPEVTLNGRNGFPKGEGIQVEERRLKIRSMTAYRVSVFSLTGKQVYATSAGRGSESREIELPPGLYTLNITTAIQEYQGRVLVK